VAKAATLNIDIVAKADQALEAFDKVKDKVEKSHAAMGLAAGLAATAIIGGLTEATKAAGEHEVGVSKLRQAYTNAGVPMDDFKKSLEDIEARSRKTGQSTEDSIAAYTDLVAATHDAGKAHSELATAEDLAAFKGISVKEAADDITRAQEGNTRSLKEMGIATKDAAGHQLSATALMESLTAAVHGQADAFGKTGVGEMARYHESLDQTKEKIGEALLPALKSVLDMLQPLFAWLSNNTAILQVLAPIIAIAAGAVVAITTAMKVWTAIQWALNVAMDANPIGLVILAIAGLVAGVILAYNHFGAFRDIVADVWSWIQALGNWILGHWKLIVDVMLGPIGVLLTNLGTVKQIISDIIGALAAIGKAVSDALGWLGKIPGGGVLSKLTGGVLSVPGGPAPTPVYIAVQATPGSDLPEVVYQALRDYQRRHVRPELRPLFG
jgi:hypothetical protein